MFMVQENRAQEAQLKAIYKKIKAVYGHIPPQMEFLGSFDVAYVEDFLTSLKKVLQHPHINLDLFAFVRLFVAFREGYVFCKGFNTQLLLSRGYSQDILDAVIADIAQVPLDSKHQRLAQKAIKAIYESETFSQEDLESVYALGWNQKDVFDLIEHTGTILKNGRILNAYMKKPLS